MYAAVVDDVGLDHSPAVSFLDLSNRITEEVIAYVSEVERLIGIG